MNDLDIQELKNRGQVAELYKECDVKLNEIKQVTLLYRKELERLINEGPDSSFIVMSNMKQMIPGLENALHTLNTYKPKNN